MTPEDPITAYRDAFADRLRLHDSDLHQLLLDHLGDIDRQLLNLGRMVDADVGLLLTLRRFVACLRAYFHFLELDAHHPRSAPHVAGADPPDPGSSKPHLQPPASPQPKHQ